MRKFIRGTFVALALAAVVGLVPSHAGAVGYEDSLDDCAYPKAFDALIMRPISFATMLVGGASLVAFAPIWLPVVNKDTPEFAHMMVVPAAKFAFARPLGQCVAITSGY
jgi:hypothetical protein